MKIRKSTKEDMPEILALYENARKFMRANGNMHQWTGGYPSEAVVLEDIAKGNSYICEEDGKAVATFCYFEDTEPTYLKIYEGKWLNDGKYGVVHRIASGKSGAGSYCLEYCFGKSGNLRIDTHRDNFPMRNLLKKLGFTYCGIIYLESGDERLAFQKTL